MDQVPNDNHEIELGLDVISEIDIEQSVVDVVEYFASKDAISYVHFRNVDGIVPRFTKVLIDEGNFDELEVMRPSSTTELRA